MTNINKCLFIFKKIVIIMQLDGYGHAWIATQQLVTPLCCLPKKLNIQYSKTMYGWKNKNLIISHVWLKKWEFNYFIINGNIIMKIS